MAEAYGIGGRFEEMRRLYEGIRREECRKVEDFINGQLSGSISYYDSAEDFYHGYLLGLLGGIPGYRIHSNKERGEDRPDLLLEPDNPRDPAVVVEVKRVRKFSQMEAACDRALRQIREMNYASGLLDEGCREVLEYGFCFCRKNCMVKVVQRKAA